MWGNGAFDKGVRVACAGRGVPQRVGLRMSEGDCKQKGKHTSCGAKLGREYIVTGVKFKCPVLSKEMQLG